jgi:hypothetical protein
VDKEAKIFTINKKALSNQNYKYSSLFKLKDVENSINKKLERT